MPIPILILSDAPDTNTGLARITRDLATVLGTMTEFRVGTMGRSGVGSRGLPWMQYTFADAHQWGEGLLPDIWKDFSGGDEGIILTIWDASRLLWFGASEFLPKGKLKNFLQSGAFKRWGYFPVDAYGPFGKLTSMSASALQGYDRVLAYSKFGQQVLNETLGRDDIDFIPHGINESVFQPREMKLGRWMLRVPEEKKLVGCVMTNQARKEWGLWAEAAFKLISANPNYHFWAHVDVLERYWSLPALIQDFGLKNHVTITTEASDEQLSYYYSACDITMLPSLGEGFGFPIAESLACGVPVVHHSYGAGAELIPEYELVGIEKLGVIPTCVDDGIGRLDTINNVYRPHLYSDDWAHEIERLTACDSRIYQGTCTESVEHLQWKNLSPVWKNWFRAGLV